MQDIFSSTMFIFRNIQAKLHFPDAILKRLPNLWLYRDTVRSASRKRMPTRKNARVLCHVDEENSSIVLCLLFRAFVLSGVQKFLVRMNF